MEKEKLLEELASCLAELRGFDDITRLTQTALDAGVEPYEVISEGLAKGMNIVGRKYDQREFFLAELIMSASLMKKAMEIVKPRLRKVRSEVSGRVVIGTVRGDLHDIGKNIVVAMLESAGFEVIDLGVDVSVDKFIEAVRKYNPEILGMSALISSTAPGMKDVINALKNANLRNGIKVIVGGAPLDEGTAKEMGADAYGRDAMEAVKIAKEIIKYKD